MKDEWNLLEDENNGISGRKNHSKEDPQVVQKIMLGSPPPPLHPDKSDSVRSFACTAAAFLDSREAVRSTAQMVFPHNFVKKFSSFSMPAAMNQQRVSPSKADPSSPACLTFQDVYEAAKMVR